MFAFINQTVPDIKRKLHSTERLGEKCLRDLVAVAEKVYTRQRTRSLKRKRQEDSLTKILHWQQACHQKELKEILLDTGARKPSGEDTFSTRPRQ